MDKPSILWVDDEIDYLKPHQLFLQQKNYQIHPCKSGTDALELLRTTTVDLVLLDHNMPGLSGIETLSLIKKTYPLLAVVMVTNNQEEAIIHEALANQVSDFLIKPVLPNQVYVCLKKILNQHQLQGTQTKQLFLKNHRTLLSDIETATTPEHFYTLYKTLVDWQLRLERTDEPSVIEMLEALFNTANNAFFNLVSEQYKGWVKGENAPILSHQVLDKIIMPRASQAKTMVLVLDNLRLDHWRALQPIFLEQFNILDEQLSMCLLPTVTQYARNAIFSGLLPEKIATQFPNHWIADSKPGLKNESEAFFFESYCKRNNLKLKYHYEKLNKEKDAQQAVKNFNKTQTKDLSFFVVNFIDQLSHANTSNATVKAMIPNDRAFRNSALNWLDNSAVKTLINQAAANQMQLIITTDHGSINVNKPSLLKGNQDHTDNLRYKHGHQIKAQEKECLKVLNPSEFGLPKNSLASTYLFAKNKYFFTYPNAYNQYANYYKNTYQHGGVSIEEMIVPTVILIPKN